ncbi:MAG: glycosyltransferase [Candidatus Aminicenantes bacterium]
MTISRVEDVSIIIPVYNEQEILRENCLYLLRLLDNQRLCSEIIIGSNGSTDRTDVLGWRLAREYSHIKFFSLPQKGVVGTVFKQAAEMCCHQKIICLDMDLTIDLSFIRRALGLLDKYDMVIGSKKAGTELRSRLRRVGSDAYIWLVRNLVGLQYSDYSIGAKAYRRPAVLPHLNHIDPGTGYVLNLIHCLRKSGNQIVQIPVSCEDRRESKFSLPYEGFYRFYHVFKLWRKEKSRALL